jgi:spermidine synthase
VIHEDAFLWLEKADSAFDIVIIDFPDPSNFAVGKLYTTAFYRRLQRSLRPGGVVAVQCTSPLSAPKSFWCVVATLEASGLRTWPYRASVPSFGEWGFVLASNRDLGVPIDSRVLDAVAADLRFLDNIALIPIISLFPYIE